MMQLTSSTVTNPCSHGQPPVKKLLNSSASLFVGESPPEGKENGAPDNRAAANGPGPSTETSSSPGQPHSTMITGRRRDRSEGLAALLDSPDLPAGRAGPYALRRQLGASKPISQREPSLAHLAASNSADLGTVNRALTQAREQQGQAQTDSNQETPAEQRVQAAASSPKAQAPAPKQQQPFAGFAPSSSAGSQYAQSAGGDQGFPGRLLSPFSQPNTSGQDPMDAFAHLPEGLRIQLQAPGAEDMSRTNSLVYNHVRFSRLLVWVLYTIPCIVFCPRASARCCALLPQRLVLGHKAGYRLVQVAHARLSVLWCVG